MKFKLKNEAMWNAAPGENTKKDHLSNLKEFKAGSLAILLPSKNGTYLYFPDYDCSIYACRDSYNKLPYESRIWFNENFELCTTNYNDYWAKLNA